MAQNKVYLELLGTTSLSAIPVGSREKIRSTIQTQLQSTSAVYLESGNKVYVAVTVPPGYTTSNYVYRIIYGHQREQIKAHLQGVAGFTGIGSVTITPPTSTPSGPMTDTSGPETGHKPVTHMGDDKPVYAGYVNTLKTWWGDGVADELGATNPRGYNTILLAFWNANQDGSSNPQDVAIAWSYPDRYGLVGGRFGSTPDEVRRNLRNEYHKNGAKVLISAFGATQFPTTQGIPARACGEHLARYVIDMQLDGVDLDYEDNSAMEAGTAVPWLVEMTDAMVETFKRANYKSLIYHAPQAPYFKKGKYRQDYVDFHNSQLMSDSSRVGDHIDKYLVQFYNQVTIKYSTYQTLFEDSREPTDNQGWTSGSALNQIAAYGIPKKKLVVGKPVTRGDATNTGYVSPDQLAAIFETSRGPGKAWANMSDVGGIMGWKFQSDRQGTWIRSLKAAVEI